MTKFLTNKKTGNVFVSSGSKSSRLHGSTNPKGKTVKMEKDDRGNVESVLNSMRQMTPTDLKFYPDRMAPIFLTDEGDFVGWGSSSFQHYKIAQSFADTLGIDPNQDDDDPRSFRVMYQFMKKTRLIRSTSTKDEFFVDVVALVNKSQLKTIQEFSGRSNRFIYDIQTSYDKTKFSGNDYKDFVRDLRKAGFLK